MDIEISEDTGPLTTGRQKRETAARISGNCRLAEVSAKQGQWLHIKLVLPINLLPSDRQMDTATKHSIPNWVNPPSRHSGVRD